MGTLMDCWVSRRTQGAESALGSAEETINGRSVAAMRGSLREGVGCEHVGNEIWRMLFL